MNDFVASSLDRLVTAWSTGPVADLVRDRGLPAITREYLLDTFAWQRAEDATRALTEHFAGARFADEVEYGVLLVPDPSKLDTRGPLPRELPSPDVFDERLPAGVALPGDRPWQLVATVIGSYGPSLGSYNDVITADDFIVDGQDTRQWMTRQVWGARVLQCGATPPDCENNERWTFTLFPGEDLVDGQAESGTVLKGKVRFRLGKPDRGIGSARVAPAVLV
ncbi:hypothetical protein [Kribbella speibonae]|uniref:Uncharacterized protein n=1 Tax=Kribbella speibonae TaxID=1572660 RepID=A0A4R0J6H8_9ACTN|nr:hypothetical protein [Kribbella speibonae]TCC18097.1 hypothetical protein E0H58_35340 [Kribbella speibonae]TCC42111.1 hypothetical protein E0H92_10925 [Kribbella speibonae]